MARFVLASRGLTRFAWAGSGLGLALLVGCGDSSPTGSAGGGASFGGAAAGQAPVAAAGADVAGSASGAAPGAGGAMGGSAGGASAGAGGSADAGGGAGAAGGVPTSPLGGAGAGGSSDPGGAGGSSGAAGNDAGKVTLFDGTGLSQWRSRAGGETAPWTATSDYFAVAPNSGDLVTRDAFGDIKLHIEFWVPATDAANAEQDRGNSGIYLQGRYEVQVLDSYEHPLEGANDCAAIYELKNADVNAAEPPGTWQTYEIEFRAPRWSGNQKVENARVSVVWNGQVAHANVEVPAPTRLGDAEAPGDAPLRLQDHGHAVRYRNVWLQRR